MSDDAGKWVVPVFPDEEISHILSAILRCLAGFQKTSPLEHETNLSKRLLKQLKQDRFLRDRPVEVEREAVIDDDVTDEEGRMDFCFRFSTGHRKPWPYFAVEAKRLHVTSKGRWRSRVPEYVTHRQGMMCFIDGRYSKGLHCGGMLGYVFDGDVPRAVSAISDLLGTHHKKLRSNKPHLLNPSPDFPSETVWTTIHQMNSRSFTLFHILTEV